MTTDDSHPAAQPRPARPEVPDLDVGDPEVPDPDVPGADVPDSEVPDAEVPDSDVPDADVPDEATLAATATPATVRRAPRIGAFIRTGVLVGAVVGWLLAVLFTSTTGEGRTGAIIISTVGGAGFGALLGAGVAVLVDRRSTRSAGRPTGDPRSL